MSHKIINVSYKIDVNEIPPGTWFTGTLELSGLSGLFYKLGIGTGMLLFDYPEKGQSEQLIAIGDVVDYKRVNVEITVDVEIVKE